MRVADANCLASTLYRRFWFDFGSVSVPFWIDFVSGGFGSVLRRFRFGAGPVSIRFWIGSVRLDGEDVGDIRVRRLTYGWNISRCAALDVR